MLFADTFNNWQEPENLAAAVRVLEATGHRVSTARVRGRAAALLRAHLPRHRHGRRSARRGAAHARRAAPLPRARRARSLGPRALLPVHVPRRVRRAASRTTPTREAPGAGREARRRVPRAPSCAPGAARRRGATPGRATIRVHGHCHQKAFGTFDATLELLRAHPGRAGRGDRVGLLRHGGRLRLRAGPLRRVDEDGRAGAAARGARRAAGTHRRRGHQLPAPDRARRGARGACIRSSCSRRRCERRATDPRRAHAGARLPAAWATRAGNLTVGRGTLDGRTVHVALIENRIASGADRRGRRPSASWRCFAIVAQRALAARALPRLGRRQGLRRARARWAPSARSIRAGLDAAVAGVPLAAVLGRNCFGGASMLAHLARAAPLQPRDAARDVGPVGPRGGGGHERAGRDVPGDGRRARCRPPRARRRARANRVWEPGADAGGVAARGAGARGRSGRRASACATRRSARGSPSARRGRRGEPLRRKDLERLFAEGYEARNARASSPARRSAAARTKRCSAS